MDPVTLFGIATAATIVGVSFLMTLKCFYTYIRSRRVPTEPQPAELRIRLPAD